jgi:hypothetical protein
MDKKKEALIEDFEGEAAYLRRRQYSTDFVILKMLLPVIKLEFTRNRLVLCARGIAERGCERIKIPNAEEHRIPLSNRLTGPRCQLKPDHER